MTMPTACHEPESRTAATNYKARRPRRARKGTVLAALATGAAMAMAPAQAAVAGGAQTSASSSHDVGGTLLVIRDGNLATIHPNGSAEHVLASQVTGASFSADGTRIAYSSYASGTSHLYTMTRAGTEVRQVTTGATGDDHPTWSPDGRWLAYDSCAADYSTCNVKRIQANAPYGTPVQLTHGGVNPTTGVCAGAASDAYLGARWHPKFGIIALQHACRYADRDSVVRPLVIAADDGALVRRLPGNLAFPDWDPSGERLAWTDLRSFDAPSRVVRQSWTGKNTTLLTPLRGPGDFANNADSATWSPDGRWIAYQKGFTDLWVTNPAGTTHRLLLKGARPVDWIAG